jgi:hypothetical protein
MDPIATAGTGGITTATPQRVFLSHTSDLGEHTGPGTFVATAVEAVLRARHAVTDMAYLAARGASPAAYCVDMVARSDVSRQCNLARSAMTEARLDTIATEPPIVARPWCGVLKRSAYRV